MTEDQIKRGLLLAPVEPSAAFQARVMRRIRQEASTPPPIPFPWGRASWIALALIAGLAAALAQPEVAAEGRVAAGGAPPRARSRTNGFGTGARRLDRWPRQLCHCGYCACANPGEALVKRLLPFLQSPHGSQLFSDGVPPPHGFCRG
jgi:hypothetical protein